MKLTPYLNFNGDCKAAFEFYEKALGGKITFMMTHEDVPASENIGPEWKDRIMHARLEIGDQHLMGSDSPPEYFEKQQGIYVSIHVDTVDEAETVFAALSEGGEVRMPIGETFWALRFGMVIDRFGTPWMINCEKPFSPE